MSGAGWNERARVLAESKADTGGAVEFRFKVPDDLGGVHDFWVEAGFATQHGAYWIAPSALNCMARCRTS